MIRGWMIGVMVEAPGEAAPVRHFFAVGQEDRARAEWRAIDAAQAIGPIAGSPVGLLEPVHAIAPLSVKAVQGLGLRAGEIRALGRRWPRTWLGPERRSPD